METRGSGHPGLLLIRAEHDHFRIAQNLARDPAEGEELIHQLRTGIKRLRAGWRLLRPALPAAVYRRENQRLRKAAHDLTAARERDVLAKTLGKLAERGGSEKASRFFPAALEAFRTRHPADGRSGEKAWHAALPVFSDSLRTMEELDLGRWGWGALEPALGQSYRKARKAYRKADPDLNDSFHEWRKRAKDLWYPLQAMTGEVAAAEKIVKRLDALQDVLGDAHDLAVLEERMSQRPGDFGDAGSIPWMGKRVRAEIRKLRKKSRRQGRKIFKRRPGKFIRKLDVPGDGLAAGSIPDFGT
jgi:CHAD domain-containing protein